jgi:hypothetical protein
MIVVATPDGQVRWTAGQDPRGDALALAQLNTPRPGDFGCVPGVPWDEVYDRKDAFLHLVAVIWPSHIVESDTEPDEDVPDAIH